MAAFGGTARRYPTRHSPGETDARGLQASQRLGVSAADILAGSVLFGGLLEPPAPNDGPAKASARIFGPQRRGPRRLLRPIGATSLHSPCPLGPCRPSKAPGRLTMHWWIASRYASVRARRHRRAGTLHKTPPGSMNASGNRTRTRTRSGCQCSGHSASCSGPPFRAGTVQPSR